MMATMHDNRLWGLMEGWLMAEGLELDDLELAGTGRARTLRVVVDADGGVDIDRIADVSEGLSRLLDNEDEFEGTYQLEVSSPGLERKLKTPRHFQKSVGREIKIKMRLGEAITTVSGTLQAADENGINVVTAEESLRASYDDVQSARTVFRWERAPKPGKKEIG